MKDRIRQIMEAQHMTQQVFANYIGTTPATLSGIFNDRTRPTINIIESIKKKFPDINLEWLMFGMGDMYQSPSPSSDHGLNSDDPHASMASSSQGQFPSSREQSLDFDYPSAPTPQNSYSAGSYFKGVRNTTSESSNEVIKIIDKPARHVTEIRVYYDDQTWESFVPSKKS